MSYYILPMHLSTWLSSAQRANVSKNKVRKDLWSDLMELISFKEEEGYMRISRANYLTLQSFCLTDGRSDTLSDDKFLSFITTLDNIRTSLNEQLAIASAAAAANDTE